MPRMTGQRSTGWRRAQGSIVSTVVSISPSGVRTATAQVVTPRIITPSSTAWPPTGASRLASRGLPGEVSLAGLPAEPFRAAGITASAGTPFGGLVLPPSTS